MKLTVSRAWLLDAAERVAGTFVAGFLAVELAASQTSWLSTSTLHAALLGGGAAALTLVKSVVASYVGSSDSASLVPSVGAVVPPSAPTVDPAPTLTDSTGRPVDLPPQIAAQMVSPPRATPTGGRGRAKGR